MDLSSSDDWSLIYEQTLSGSQLPNFLIPANFTSQILAIYISVPNASSTWHTGGWLNQQPQTAELVDSSTTWNSYSKRLSLGGNIISFPNEFDSYEIEINFPKWFDSVFIAIWQYSGFLNSEITTIDTIATNVSEIFTLLTT